MKATVLLFAGVLALAACSEASTTSTESAVVSQETTFLTRVVGKELVNENGTVTYREDGTFSGTSGGEALQGRWTFQNDRYCVKGSVGGRAFPAECQNLIYSGDQVTFDGKDFDVTYTIPA